MKRKIVRLALAVFLGLTLGFSKGFCEKIAESGPNLEKLFTEARELYNQKKYTEAEEAFFKILAKFPRNYLENDLMLALGLGYIRQEEMEKAENIFKALVRDNPQYKELDLIKFNLGLIAYRQEDFSKALSCFGGIKDKEAMIYTAQCLSLRGQGMMAIAKYKELLDDYDQEIAGSGNKYILELAERGIAQTFYQMEQYSVAAEKLDKFLNNYPKSSFRSYARCLLGLCYFQKEDFAQAISHFQIIVNDYGNENLTSLAHYFWAESLYRSGKVEEAVGLYRRIVEIYKKEGIASDAYYRFCSIYALRGDYGQAIQLCDQGSFAQDRFLVLKGICYQKQKKYPQAREQYRSLIEKNKNEKALSLVLFLLAKSYYEEGDYPQLVAYYQNVFNLLYDKLDPSDEEKIWLERSLLYIADGYYHLSYYPEGERLYQQVFDRKVTPELAALALGGLEASFAQKGEFDAAMKKLTLLKEVYKMRLSSEALTTSDLEMANLYFNRKNWEKAIGYYNSFTELYPKDPRVEKALYQVGVSLSRLGYYSEAVKTWKDVYTGFPASNLAPDSLNRAAITAFSLGDYNKTNELSRELIAAYPNSSFIPEAYLRIAQSYYNNKNYEQAIVGYQEFLDKFAQHPQVNDAKEGIRTSYLQIGEGKNLEELERYAKKYKGSKFAGELYWHIGAMTYEVKDYPKAIIYFEEVVSNYSNTPSAKQAAFYLGECYYLKNDYKRAIIAYKNFLNSFLDDEFGVAVKFHQANAHFQLNQLPECLEIYKEIVEMYPKSDYAKNSLINLAFVYESLGKNKEALESYLTFEAVYSSDEKSNFVFNQIAKISEMLEDYPQAIMYYQKVKPGPEIAASEIEFHLSACYKNLGQMDKAIECYQRLRQVGDGNDYFWLNGLIQLAEIYEQQKKIPQAVEVYDELINKVQDKSLKQTFVAKKDELNKQPKGN
ncbi:MAG: tetratricopeptide repeat protein [Elusimicrobiota bacterium]